VKEAEWVDTVAEVLRKKLSPEKSLQVKTGLKLAYGYEIDSYSDAAQKHPIIKASKFQTDLAIIETIDGRWKPRVVVEAKLRRVSTHDAITYSHKARIHRAVHPYLRYGIMLGDRGGYPLPGRLYRHGAQFDFMISFKGNHMAVSELSDMIKLLRSEIKASRSLEKILYESRSRNRDRYTVLHRKLLLR
jgi:hypothetical protein